MLKKKYLILELANSHNGVKSNIYKILDKINFNEVKNVGLKYQIISKKYLSVKPYKWHKVYQKLFFNKKIWKKIIFDSSKLNIDIWLDIFDIYGVQILKENFSRIYGVKLQSSVLNNYELISELEKLKLNNKKILINIAGHNYSEIKFLIKKMTAKFNTKPIIQVGFQNYPTEKKYIHLNKIKMIRPILDNCETSFADHLSFSDKDFLNLSVFAFKFGYDYVEKHVCFDRKKSKYDFHSAANPNEINKIFEKIKTKNYNLKTKLKNFIRKDLNSKAEKKYLNSTIILPIVNKDLNKGSLISNSDLIFRRTPDSGLSYETLKKKISEKFILSQKVKKFSTLQNSFFTKPKIGTIIAGRMKSSRLKNKALRKIFKRSSISRCLESCKKIKLSKKVILATSYLKTDDILKKEINNKHVKIFRGHPEDVISRYINAAEKYHLDIIVRGTADCPYISKEIIDFLINSHFEKGADFTYANNSAPGTSAEIYNLSTLKFIKKKKRNTSLSEYMTWYVMNNKKYFKINNVTLPKNLSRNYRLTLDYQEDLRMFNLLYEKLNKKKLKVNLSNIFHIMDKDRKLRNINKNCKLIFKTNRKLIRFLNKNTKF